MQTIRFNTKRKYTKFGQRITATRHNDNVVTFHDHDRMITGEFTLGDDEPFTQHTVMSRYDMNEAPQSLRSIQDGNYAGAVNAEWKE